MGPPGASWGFLEPPGGFLEPPGTLKKHVSGASWGLPGTPGVFLEASWSLLGASWNFLVGPPGASWGLLGPPGALKKHVFYDSCCVARSRGVLGGLMGPPGASRDLLGLPWGFLGPPGSLLGLPGGASWSLLGLPGASWGLPGASWGLQKTRVLRSLLRCSVQRSPGGSKQGLWERSREKVGCMLTRR